MKEILKKNIKFISVMAIVIVLGIVGSTYAARTSRFNLINVNAKAATIAAYITYDNSGDEEVISTNAMAPIVDSQVTYNSTDPRVIKSKFYVTGDSSNPNNTIYDISLRDIVMPCELRTSEVKWKLYKGTTEISSGTFSPEFDAMSNQRLVLTTTQNDLTTTSDEYTFVMWISESCRGNIEMCLDRNDSDQSKYLNKTFTANLKVETSTGSKKTLVRRTASGDSCRYDTVSLPTCNTLTYNGNSQTLINTSSYYTLTNNAGTNAGNYTVTAKLNDGYKWPDNTTGNKTINCSINKKQASIIALDQSISSSNPFVNSTSMVTTSNFASNDEVSSISLYLDEYNDVIIPSAAAITKNNRSGNDVTDNYQITYINGNVITKDIPTVLVDFDNVIEYGNNYEYEYTVVNNVPITCSTSNSSIATCTVSNDGKVVVTPTGLGSVTIILTSAETEVYDQAAHRYNTIVVCSRSASEPTISNHAYNSNIQTGVIGGSHISKAGSLTGTNVSSYTATATPVTGYCWSDGTRTTKTYVWQIIKSPSVCTIASIPALTTSGTTATGQLQFSCVGDGSVTVTSGDTSVITVSNVTSTSATLTAVAAGSSDITIRMTEGNNYLLSTTTRSISVTNSTYVVSYDANGGTGAPDPQTKVSGTALTLASEIPTREGYTFVKWNTQANGNGTDYNPGGSYTANASATLYAQWTEKTITVTLDDNRFWADNKTKNGITVSYDPTTHNLTLNGTQSGNVVLQAYPHTFTANDVYRTTFTYVSGSVSYSDSYCMVTEPKKDRSGTNLSTRNYACDKFPTVGSSHFDLTISSTGASEGKVLYNYIWVNSGASVTYNNYVVHVDVRKVNTKTVTYGGTYGSITPPTRTGFTFNNWYSEEVLGSTISSTTTVTNPNDHAIYAHWSKKTYTVSYNCNGGTGSISSNTATFTGTYTIATSGCSRTGYTFAGWTTNSNGNDDGYNWTNWSGIWKYDNGEYGIANNALALYARWTANQYTITLNKNGGTTNGTGSVVATYNSSTLNPASITVPQRTYTISYNANGTGITMPSSSTVSYTLNGWFTDSSGGSKVLTSGTSPTFVGAVSGYTNPSNEWFRTSDATLYAQWTSASFTLPALSKTGYTCKWAEGSASGTQYAPGTSRTPTANTTYYAVCTDTTPPTISATYKIGNDTYNGGWTNQTISTTVSYSDTGSGIDLNSIAWKVDNGSWNVRTATNSSTYSDSWSAERNSVAYYRICDTAGNCAETTGQTIKIDKTAPSPPTTMEFVYGDWSRYTRGTLATNTTVYAAYSQDAKPPSGAKDESGNANSGVAKYQISSDNSTWYDYSYNNSNSLYKLTENGTRYYRAVDNAGNTSTSISRVATFTETINALRYTQKNYNGTNRVAVYYVTTCTYSTCTYTRLNGLTKSVIDAKPAYNTEAFSSPITKSSLITSLNTNYRYTWYVTATDGLYCRSGADADSGNGSVIITGYGYCTALSIYRTTTKRDTNGYNNWVWYPDAQCYLAGDWLDTYANSGCGGSGGGGGGGGGGGSPGEQCYWTNKSECNTAAAGMGANCSCTLNAAGCWVPRCMEV